MYEKLSVTDPIFRREKLVLLRLVLIFPYSCLYVLQPAYIFNQHTHSPICQTNPVQQGWAEHLLWAIPWRGVQTHISLPTLPTGAVSGGALLPEKTAKGSLNHCTPDAASPLLNGWIDFSGLTQKQDKTKFMHRYKPSNYKIGTVFNPFCLNSS